VRRSLCGKSECGDSFILREAKLHCLLNKLTCRRPDLFSGFVIHKSSSCFAVNVILRPMSGY